MGGEINCCFEFYLIGVILLCGLFILVVIGFLLVVVCGVVGFIVSLVLFML